MSTSSKIEWTDTTWNPITGCTRVSPGCVHCYAKTMHERFHGPGSFDTVSLHPERLGQPLRWRKPSRVFVNSMSDLFHDDVPTEFIARVFAVMAATPQHTYQVLTKRHGRMRSLLSHAGFRLAVYDHLLAEHANDRRIPMWPLANVWLGVSAESQQWADIRIPALLETPAAVRFVSAEPLLGPIDLRAAPESVDYEAGIDWVIVGGESGPGARPMYTAWAGQLVDDCRAANVPVFVKQLGSVWAREREAKHRKGGDPAEWPEALRVRQYPAGASA